MVPQDSAADLSKDLAQLSPPKALERLYSIVDNEAFGRGEVRRMPVSVFSDTVQITCEAPPRLLVSLPPPPPNQRYMVNLILPKSERWEGLGDTSLSRDQYYDLHLQRWGEGLTPGATPFLSPSVIRLSCRRPSPPSAEALSSSSSSAFPSSADSSSGSAARPPSVEASGQRSD